MKRTILGNFMYNTINNLSLKLARHKWLYYILNLTWGLPLTLIGFIVTLGLLLVGKKPKRYHGIYYFNVGRCWGGFETGLMFVRDTDSTEDVSMHELGHTYQNAILGPFMLVLVSIPSFRRYWYREYNYDKQGVTPPTDYDLIWFEGSATYIGTTIVKR